MKLYDLMEVIRDYDTEVDVVDSSETIIYKIKRGERWGSKYYDICKRKVNYLTAIDHRTVEVRVD